MSTKPMSGFNSQKRWPEGAIEDWQQGASYGWIAEKYGRGYSTVAKLIRAQKLVGTQRLVDISQRKRNGGRPPLHERKPLSPAHMHIGLKISHFRDIANEYTCTEFAKLIDTNRLTARLMELGLHDFKLSELRTIAKTINLSIADLIGPEGEAVAGTRPEENVDYYRKRP